MTQISNMKKIITILIGSAIAISVIYFSGVGAEIQKSAYDYKDGTILLIKSAATSEVKGAYQAGDIVDVKDGAELYKRFGTRDFLGKEERTRLFPVYYPVKLTAEQRENLVISDVTRRRLFGVDYTKFLTGKEVLKIRNFEGISSIPKINDTHIIAKTTGQVSVVILSEDITRIEKVKNAITNTFKKIARAIIRIAYAITTNTKIVDPDNAVGTDYTSLSLWEAGRQANLVTGDAIEIAKCRSTSGTNDTTALAIAGWTTSATQYIKIWADPTDSYRHAGVWDDTKFVLQITTGGTDAISIGINTGMYLTIDGLQIQAATSTTLDSHGIMLYGAQSGTTTISNNIIKSGGTGTNARGTGIYAYSASTVDLKAYNNIIYNFVGTAAAVSGNGFYLNDTTITNYLYNNTLYNLDEGMHRALGATIAINNIIASTTAGAWGTFAAGTDYNATDDASIGYTVTDSGNTHDRLSQTFTFTATGTNFHLASTDAGARNYGNDLSADAKIPFSTDIDSETRPSESVWDIGADEYIAPSAGGVDDTRINVWDE